MLLSATLGSLNCKGLSVWCLEHNHHIGSEILSTTDLALDWVAKEAVVLTALSLKASHKRITSWYCGIALNKQELGFARMYVAMITL